VAKGRFIEALEVGISMGKTIPPVLAELLDEALAEGDEGRIIDTMAKTFAKCRETAGALHFATPTSGRIDVDADWPKGDDK
jgi:hypothetical protein